MAIEKRKIVVMVFKKLSFQGKILADENIIGEAWNYFV